MRTVPLLFCRYHPPPSKREGVYSLGHPRRISPKRSSALACLQAPSPRRASLGLGGRGKKNNECNFGSTPTWAKMWHSLAHLKMTHAQPKPAKLNAWIDILPNQCENWLCFNRFNQTQVQQLCCLSRQILQEDLLIARILSLESSDSLLPPLGTLSFSILNGSCKDVLLRRNETTSHSPTATAWQMTKKTTV